MGFFYSDGSKPKQKVSSLQRQLADLDASIEKLEDRRSKVFRILQERTQEIISLVDN